MEGNAKKYEYALEMIGITKEFPGVKALDDVQLKIRPHSVHALMGENGAGKSTLMKCLFGIYNKDAGKIYLDGQEINFKSSKEALEYGVSMVHQELNQVLQRNVMDNIWLGRYPKKAGFIDEEKMYKDTKKIFEDLEINIDPRIKVEKLSVSQMQMLEIAKAVSYKSKVLILDEPTSSLTENEVNHLFKIVRKLKDQGIGVVYISHKMEEITALCDEITILRDGKWIATEKVEGMSTDHVINLMVGRDLTSRFPEKSNIPKEVIMEVKNLTAKVQPSIIDVTFDLHKGEILGIAGLVGAKRTEIVETIFGMRSIESGEIYIHGKKTNIRSPKEATQNGLALITEERRTTGIFGMLDIKFNSIISNIKSYKGTAGLLDDSKITKDTKWVIDSMRVKTPTQKTQIGSLSGVNQQKVIIGRWLLTEPEILLMDEPTRGIDVGAKFEIYQLMINLATKDKGVVMISSEMPELLGVTDRILVMSNGRVAGIVNTKETSQDEILKLTAKYLKEVEMAEKQLEKKKFNAKELLMNGGIYLVLIILLIIIGIKDASFFSLINFQNILTQSSVRVIIALGVAGLILTQGTDLSAGRQVGVAALVSAIFLQASGKALTLSKLPFGGIIKSMPPQVAIVMVIIIVCLIGALFGFINGFIIAKLQVTPFITTLGTMIIFYGFNSLLFDAVGASPVASFKPEYSKLVQGAVFESAQMRLSYLIVYATIATLIMWVVWNKTTFGKNIYAVGGNSEAARLSGINVDRITMIVFASMGMLAALSGILYTSRLQSATTTAGTLFELDAIAAAYVGGVSANGGIGKVTGSVIGALVMASLTNGMNLVGVGISYQYIIRGVILAVAVIFDVKTRNTVK